MVICIHRTTFRGLESLLFIGKHEEISTTLSVFAEKLWIFVRKQSMLGFRGYLFTGGKLKNVINQLITRQSN